MWSKELEVATRLAFEAGRVALEVHEREFTVEQKKNRDPVTEADRRANELIVGALRTAFPADLVVGEESDEGVNVDASRAWFVDPVDGTADFIMRNGEWSIMIGLVVEGRPRVGVVYQPVTGAMYTAASGGGAFVQVGTARRQLRVSDDPDARRATVVLSRNHPDPRTERVLAELGVTQRYEHGSIGCKLAQIAERRADIYFNFSGKCSMWDTAGPEVVLREAGGAIVDLDGNPIRYAGTGTLVEAPFVCTTTRLLPHVLSTLSAVRDEVAPRTKK